MDGRGNSYVGTVSETTTENTLGHTERVWVSTSWVFHVNHILGKSRVTRSLRCSPRCNFNVPVTGQGSRFDVQQWFWGSLCRISDLVLKMISRFVDVLDYWLIKRYWGTKTGIRRRLTRGFSTVKPTQFRNRSDKVTWILRDYWRMERTLSMASGMQLDVSERTRPGTMERLDRGSREGKCGVVETSKVRVWRVEDKVPEP